MSSSELINFAKKFIGVPYVFGGTTPKGFDCSGFVQYVYKHALGINISRTTQTQINEGREVSRNELQPGDLVFTNQGHVTLYIGNNQVIHAPQTGDKVKISNLWAFWRARRILNNENRDLSPVFNLGYYKQNNPDVVKAFGNNTDAIMNHFLSYGMKEGRTSSPNFNLDFYKSNNQDLKNAYGNNKKEYYIHYMIYGRDEGRKAN